MDTTHTYRVQANSTIVRGGLAIAENIQPSISFNAPPEFQGQPGCWTPEHFLVAAVASCFVSTFSGMAAASKLDYLSLTLDAEGSLERDGIGWRFREIALRPTLKLLREADSDRGNRILVKAEKTCLIGRSLACPLSMEQEVTWGEELVSR